MKHAAQTALGALAALCAVGISVPATAAWEPVRPVEFIVPAGTGGGADQMARTIQGIVTKHNLMKQPMVVINKSGGAGGEGFLDLKTSGGNPHKIVITLSNLFTTPLATGIPFSWKDLTPVAMLALIPYKGGGEVAVQLVGNHLDSTVNNPIEAVAQWRGGKVRPLCVFDAQPMTYDEQIADGKSWKDIPTCKSQGLDIEYLMLRGIFMTPRATKDQVEFYIELFKKVRATPEWQDFMKSGAFNTTFMTGADYAKWVEAEEKRHETLMKDAGFLASPGN